MSNLSTLFFQKLSKLKLIAPENPQIGKNILNSNITNIIRLNNEF